MQGACKSAGQALQARASAAALQASQTRLGSCKEAGSSSSWAAPVQPGQPAALTSDLPHTVQRQIVAGRRVLDALVKVNVRLGLSSHS